LSTHPRTRKKIDEIGLSFNNLVRLTKPLGLPDYIRLQISAKTVLSDSGSLTEESSILNFPAINIRDVHERPEGMEEGAVIFTGMDVNLILHAIKVIADQGRGEERSINLVEDYKANNVSEKVLRTILSYVHYINRVVWKK
jgi:UDP-N-acetylglucosamine 2-epimerase (non-hydrolysing)